MEVEECYFFSNSPFAIDISSHSVRLLYRLRGAPTVIGDISFFDVHLEKKVSRLYSDARKICGASVSVSVILPREFILYRSIEGHFDNTELRKWEASKVVFQKNLHIDEVDLYLKQTSDILNIAAIETTILKEIKEFVTSFGFLVVRTIARPSRGKYKFYPQFDEHAPLVLPAQSRTNISI